MPRDVMSSPNESRYRPQIARSAGTALSQSLSEKVAQAVFEFINGPLLENPHLVGKPLRVPLAPGVFC
jgi:mRNA interferase RelE/StbE